MLEEILHAQVYATDVCMRRWMTWTMPSASRASRRPARPSLPPRVLLTPPLPLSEEQPSEMPITGAAGIRSARVELTMRAAHLGWQFSATISAVLLVVGLTAMSAGRQFCYII